MIQEAINEINNLISTYQWCDFEFIELRGNLIIGGRTGFDAGYDFKITFEDVFLIQCLYQWKTDTSKVSFLIPQLEEQREMNAKYGIEQGYTLFKIIPEDLTAPMYISAKNITLQQ